LKSKEETIMSVQKLLSISAAAIAAFSPVIAASAAPDVPASRLTSSPLVQAKTITVHEQFRLFDSKTGKSAPFFNNTVLISRPGKIKLIVSQAEKPGSKPHLYVSDGKTEYEYNALTNQYSLLPPVPAGQSSSQLRDMAGVNMILNGGPRAPFGQTHRTVTSELLDGRAMIVTTDTHPSSVGVDGVAYVRSTKTWVDAKTRLPYRWELLSASNGKTMPQQELDFSDWALNKPIPAAQLAWVPPAGSNPYSEPKMLAAGTPAPDFSVLTPDGKTVHLSDYKGKTVVLDFWATWCGPCQHSMPHLEKVYQQVKDKNVAVLGVCVWDEKPAYDKWVAKNIGTVYNFPVAFDPAGRGKGNIAGSLYKVTGIPTQYIIDKNGNVAASTIGYEEGDTRLEANLSKLGVDIAMPAKTASAKSASAK
jgi:peroxiredoxin/outer membrane lipoprotein-sorting protein